MAIEETLYSDELIALLSKYNISEDLQELKIGKKYSILKNGKTGYITIEGISYGAYEDLYTVSIG